MTKADIIHEIKRVTQDRGGNVPGMRSFEHLTGIRKADWFGVFWRSWGDAVREAGLIPNTLTPKIDDDELLRQYCLLTRELGRFPAKGDIKLKKRADPFFPSDVLFARRFGSYPAARHRARAFASSNAEFADVVDLLPVPTARRAVESREAEDCKTGYVYLVKHGSRNEYKIGKTINPLRREGEVRIQLPETLRPIHYIETDDPSGVEAYWHNRFAAKRKEGEWFNLDRADVAAFKRWKRLV